VFDGRGPLTCAVAAVTALGHGAAGTAARR